MNELSFNGPYRTNTMDTAQEKIRQALLLLQEATLLTTGDTLMEEYEYSVNPNCYDSDDEETYDSIEISMTIRVNRRHDSDDD
jgi:hypothetical protein